MYRCNECNRSFEKPEKTFEAHGLSSPPFEELLICPYCRGTDMEEE